MQFQNISANYDSSSHLKTDHLYNKSQFVAPYEALKWLCLQAPSIHMTHINCKTQSFHKMVTKNMDAFLED